MHRGKLRIVIHDVPGGGRACIINLPAPVSIAPLVFLCRNISRGRAAFIPATLNIIMFNFLHSHATQTIEQEYKQSMQDAFYDASADILFTDLSCSIVSYVPGGTAILSTCTYYVIQTDSTSIRQITAYFILSNIYDTRRNSLNMCRTCTYS